MQMLERETIYGHIKNNVDIWRHVSLIVKPKERFMK